MPLPNYPLRFNNPPDEAEFKGMIIRKITHHLGKVDLAMAADPLLDVTSLTDFQLVSFYHNMLVRSEIQTNARLDGLPD